MHILEIPSFFVPYGGRFCLDQAKALKGQGHEVRILSNVQLSIKRDVAAYFSLPYGQEETLMEGIPVTRRFQRGIPMLIRPNVEQWVWRVCRMFRRYAIEHGKPDVLHAHCAKWAGYAAMLIGREHHIPYVITEHLSLMSLQEEFGDVPDRAWQIPLLTEAYHRAAWVLPVAGELVENTACYYGTDYRWQAVSNVVDTDFFSYRPRKPLGERPLVFCCLANFDSRKGYDILASAYRRVIAGGNRVRLCIAGEGTDSRACRRLLDMEGVELLGLLDRQETADLLYRSDALVLPSRDEVQPLAVLEAMSTGIPVVATEAVPQSLRLEGCCRIVPTDNADRLAAAMQDVCRHYDFDGQAISQQVSRLASPEVIGRKLSEIFAQVQGQTPREAVAHDDTNETDFTG